MTPEARAISIGPTGVLHPEAAATLRVSPRPAVWMGFALAVLAAGYCLGSILGLSLSFPGTHISAIWPPNAILLAALLLTPRRRWWACLLAVLPAHLLAQGLMGLPWKVVLINFVGNAGDALIGALAICHFTAEPKRLDGLRTVILIIVFGGFLAPAIMSAGVAALFAWIGMDADSWLTWRLRLLTNSLAVFTLVPLILAAAPKILSRKWTIAWRRSLEAGALLAALLAVGILVFLLPRAGSETPALLYLPLPLLLWGTVRFGLPGACLSMATLIGLSTWGVMHGYGPFTAQHPIENAASLILFLNFTCGSHLILAALLAERRHMERARRQGEALHGAVLASLHDHVGVLDRDGVILEVNEAWRTSANGCAARMEPGANYLEACRAAASQAGEDSAAAQSLAGMEAVLSGDRTRFQMEYASGTPSRPLWFEMSVEGLKRPEGGAVITHTDITGRRQAELEAQQQRRELAHLTRVATLGELSGALAHELNQPLTAILSNAQAGNRLLARNPVDLEEVREILQDIAKEDRRAGEVIQRLRAMLKKEEAKILPLDLNELVRDMLALAHSDLVTRNIALDTRLEPRLPLLYGDHVQIQQVLLNLILNACEAMSTKRVGERRLTVVTARDGDEGLRLSVIDHGTGIPADEMDRIFEPFFTTKEHGLGLGLPICRSIVTAHGGQLWASNNEDGGATFHLTLPLHDGEP